MSGQERYKWPEQVKDNSENRGAAHTAVVDEHSPTTPVDWPLVSVIIPVYNGAGTLAQSLQAVFNTTYPCYEVIVGDDGSTDDSMAMAAGFPCTVVPSPHHRGAAAMRNRLVAIAQGDILFFTDADVLIAPDTLTRLVETLLAHPEYAAVIGTYTRETPVPNFISAYKSAHHHWVNQTTSCWPASFFTACGAVRRAVFDEVTFDETWDRCLEDVVFGMDLVRKGLTIYVEKNVTVVHLKRYSLAALIRSDLWNRAVPWTKLLLQRRHFPNELNTTWRDRLATAFVAMLLLAVPMALLGFLPAGMAVFTITGLLGLFLATNRAFWRFLWREQGGYFTLRAIPLHYIFYLTCGVGFVIGLLAHTFDKQK